MNAVIFVAKRNQGTTAEELILQQKKRRRTPVVIKHQMKRPIIIMKKSHFQRIPNEILIMIFERMESKELYHCSTVTKHWNELLTPILWKSPIPIKPLLKSCSIIHRHQQHIYPGFPLHLSRYGHAVKSLDLSLIGSHVTDCTIRHIIRSCPHLIHLNLSHCRFITNEGLRCLIGIPNLKVLILQNCRQITDIGLNYLKESLFCLNTIHLGGCTRLTDNGIIGLVTASGSTIRRINISDCNRVTGITLEVIANTCESRLEWLDISRTKLIRHKDLEFLIKKCKNITRLNISLKKQKSLNELRNQLSFTTRQFMNESETTIEELNENNPLNELIDLLNRFNIQPNLTNDSLQHQQYLINQQIRRDSVSNQTIEFISLNLKKLQHLNLSNWSCLNDKTIQLLSINSHCLTYLNLIGCQSITNKVLSSLSDLCERKSTCITLSDLMISPNDNSYESSFSVSSEDSLLSKLPTKP